MMGSSPTRSSIPGQPQRYQRSGVSFNKARGPAGKSIICTTMEPFVQREVFFSVDLGRHALMHIRSLARATLNDNDDAKAARQHMEFILKLVDRALPPRKRKA